MCGVPRRTVQKRTHSRRWWATPCGSCGPTGAQASMFAPPCSRFHLPDLTDHGMSHSDPKLHLRWTGMVIPLNANGLMRSGMTYFTYSTDYPCVPTPPATTCNPMPAQGFLCALEQTKTFADFTTWWNAQPPLYQAFPTRPWLNGGRCLTHPSLGR